MILQIVVMIINYALFIFSAALSVYYRMKNERVKYRNSTVFFYVMLIATAVRSRMFVDKVPFHLGIKISIAALICLIIVVLAMNIYKKRTVESIDNDENEKLSGEDKEFLKFVIIAAVIFFAVMFGAYYLSHNVLN